MTYTIVIDDHEQKYSTIEGLGSQTSIIDFIKQTAIVEKRASCIAHINAKGGNRLTTGSVSEAKVWPFPVSEHNVITRIMTDYVRYRIQSILAAKLARQASVSKWAAPASIQPRGRQINSHTGTFRTCRNPHIFAHFCYYAAIIQLQLFDDT